MYKENYEFIKRFSFLALGLVVLSFLSIGKSAYAVSYYGLNCTNKAYGTQHIGADTSLSEDMLLHT